MTISSRVKAVLAYYDKRQNELAEHFGMSRQVMSNKMQLDRWSGRDLAKVADFVGCKLAFVLPDGQQINIETEDKEEDPDV